MANYKAVSAGNWSQLARWQDDSSGSYQASSVLPGVNDYVYANNYDVNIDQNITVSRLSQAATTNVSAGGRFIPTVDCSITCTNGLYVVASLQSPTDLTNGPLCILTSRTLTISGNVNVNYGGRVGIANFGANSVITYTGNLQATGIGAKAFYNEGQYAKITGVGNITAATANTAVSFAYHNIGANAEIKHTGIFQGSSGGSSNAYAFYNEGAYAKLELYGNVYGGSGATIRTTGYSSLLLDIVANQVNATSMVVVSGGTEKFTLRGTVSSPNTTKVVSYSTTTTCILDGCSVKITGVLLPIGNGPMVEKTNKANKFLVANSITGLDTEFYSEFGTPIAKDVRKDTVYGPNDIYTGTLAVPSPSNVSSGVPTDDTVGTADFELSEVMTALGVVNEGVKKASILVPHNEDI